ncbi:glycogen debranching protein [Croceivirga sp. JEA036]|uniref:alpha-L-rhamnosidase-related protein n=1 Tax=Croceivirga sp. JEA036 TaxID=2721162 RepID=UPI00143BD7B3|nr:glycogen debranching protein [Croceivirga sp. JEA036]NJB37188.1 glycogen debranching protein [Croceivirga sp. JEA036]
MKLHVLVFLSLLCFACKKNDISSNIAALSTEIEHIQGKSAYLDSPFVTAGNRVYMVGHQNGSFPDLGWHIKGEMGGIWNHPIKLMDGFELSIILDNKEYALTQADIFTNYPFYNQHTYNLEEPQLQIERWQFVPDDTEGVLVQVLIKNKSKTPTAIDLNFKTTSDLRPTWLGERTDMIDGKDRAEFDSTIDGFLIKDEANSWFTAFNSSEKSTGNTTEVTIDNTSLNSLQYEFTIGAQKDKLINFAIAGSYTSKEATLKTLKNIQQHWHQAFVAKKSRYQALAQKTKLTIPDKDMEQAFRWLKYNCNWLIRNVPEVGSGITAGLPDYPWWFGVDSEYALQGYMAVGQTDAVYNTIRLLDSVSEKVNGNGKIIHEMSTNGAVFNPGNINETPQFATLLWRVYQWNGDKAFLKRYFPTVKKGLAWLLAHNDLDKNGFPEGFGMMEIHGLDSEMIDVAAYTQQAFAAAAQMAMELNQIDLAKDYHKKATELTTKINQEFWSDDFNSYADFIGTDEQALHLIDDAIIRADTLNKPWAIKELKNTADFIKKNPSDTPRPFVLHHNWVVNTPMEVGIADTAKALKALQTAEQFVNPFGVFVTGIDRDASAGADENTFVAPKVFSYTGAVMTLPTGVQAIAENNYNRPDKALEYLERMTRSFSYALPGSMYEVSPDYGMMTQAWNIYSYAYPMVHQFFGIQPEAQNKTVHIKPNMPSKWNKASLENVQVGDGENSVSVYFERKGDTIKLKVTQINTDWTLLIDAPRGFKKITANSNEAKANNSEKRLTSNAKEISLTISK